MNNNCILTIEPSKWRRLIKYVSFSYTTVFLFCMIILMATALYKSIKLSFNIGDLFSFINIGFSTVFLLMSLFLFWGIKYFRLARSLFKTKIEFFDNCIEFTNIRGFQYKISKSEIIYIFAWKRRTLIIFGDNENLSFFIFREDIYGSRQLKDINEYFKESDKYMDNYKKIRQIVKDNNLRRLFSMRNSLENILIKNS